MPRKHDKEVFGAPSDEFDENEPEADEPELVAEATEAKVKVPYHTTEKGRASHKAYSQSEAGKAAREKYMKSEAGTAARKKWQQSEKGKAAMKAYRTKHAAALRDAKVAEKANTTATE